MGNEIRISLLKQIYGSEPDPAVSRFSPVPGSIPEAPLTESEWLGSPHALLLVGSEGGILHVNPAACRFFEHDEGMLKSRLLSDLVLRLDAEILKRVFALLRVSRPVVLDALCVRRNGIWVSSSLSMVLAGEEGESPMLLVWVKAMNRPGPAEAAPVAAALSNRAECIEMASAVAGQIAHDFNNYLTPVLAYPDLIRQVGPLDPTAAEYLDIIQKSAEDMERLTQKLMALARRGRASSELLDLNDVVTQAMMSVQPGLPAATTVVQALASGLSPIQANRDQLVRVVDSLIQNAVEAMPGGGQVVVSTGMTHLSHPVGGYAEVKAGDYVCLTVQDSGTGINAEDRVRIFDPFFTTRKALKKRGAGLGLSIVLGITRDHGGYVEFESEPGKGTAFRVFLPAVLPAGAPSGSEPPGGLVPASLGQKVSYLIVDDDPMIRRLFGLILLGEFPEARIEQASDGEKALEAFGRERFDVVILDLQMPVRDGREAYLGIESLCRERGWVPPRVVFCTGYAPPKYLEDIIRDNPAHCLIRKPVKAEALLECVRKVIGAS